MIWIIDDDEIFKFVTTFQLKKVVGDEKILLFSDITTAFDSLKSTTEIPNFIFLDINFPDFSGWDFLDNLSSQFEKSPFAKTHIYMVSSSISNNDKELVENYKFVKGLLQKPIKNGDLERILKNDMQN